jgi:hypothetical protein
MEEHLSIEPVESLQTAAWAEKVGLIAVSYYKIMTIKLILFILFEMKKIIIHLLEARMK